MKKAMATGQRHVPAASLGYHTPARVQARPTPEQIRAERARARSMDRGGGISW